MAEWGARAVEHLRQISVELEMALIRNAVQHSRQHSVSDHYGESSVEY